MIDTDETTTEPEWTGEVPTEPGNYWMYGWTSAHNRGSPRRRLVKVQKTRSGASIYVTEGRFIYTPALIGLSLWTPAEIPQAPHYQLEKMLGVFLNWDEEEFNG
jgi:hypothetical protein